MSPTLVSPPVLGGLLLLFLQTHGELFAAAPHQDRARVPLISTTNSRGADKSSITGSGTTQESWTGDEEDGSLPRVIGIFRTEQNSVPPYDNETVRRYGGLTTPLTLSASRDDDGVPDAPYSLQSPIEGGDVFAEADMSNVGTVSSAESADRSDYSSVGQDTTTTTPGGRFYRTRDSRNERHMLKRHKRCCLKGRTYIAARNVTDSRQVFRVCKNRSQSGEARLGRTCSVVYRDCCEIAGLRVIYMRKKRYTRRYWKGGPRMPNTAHPHDILTSYMRTSLQPKRV